MCQLLWYIGVLEEKTLLQENPQYFKNVMTLWRCGFSRLALFQCSLKFAILVAEEFYGCVGSLRAGGDEMLVQYKIEQ
jgi:hypothetical protein